MDDFLDLSRVKKYAAKPPADTTEKTRTPMSDSEKVKVAAAVLDTIGDVIDVFKAYTNLQAKRAEWDARLRIAQVGLEKARLETQAVVSAAQERHRQLDQTGHVLDELLDFFRVLKNERKSLPLSSIDAAKVDEKLFQIVPGIVAALNKGKD